MLNDSFLQNKKNPESKKLLYSAHKVWYTEIILDRNFMGLKKTYRLYMVNFNI